MLGQMMTRPLTISSLIDHAERHHGPTGVASAETAGGIAVTSWAEVARNARRLASALGRFGLQPGKRVATIAWNNRRHLELYFGVSGGGFVCHTINPRRFPEQLVHILNHASDRLLFLDATFLPLALALKAKLPKQRGVVLPGPGLDGPSLVGRIGG
jgi:3-(methylthio)propionyl---CoA ligase